MHRTPPAAKRLLALLAEQRGTDFDAWVQQMRSAGVSWRAISNLIADNYDTNVSVWTLARWYADQDAA